MAALAVVVVFTIPYRDIAARVALEHRISMAVYHATTIVGSCERRPLALVTLELFGHKPFFLRAVCATTTEGLAAVGTHVNRHLCLCSLSNLFGASRATKFRTELLVVSVLAELLRCDVDNTPLQI